MRFARGEIWIAAGGIQISATFFAGCGVAFIETPDKADLFEKYRYFRYKIAVQFEESHPGEFVTKEKFTQMKQDATK